jgi:phage terminase small subunit
MSNIVDANAVPARRERSAYERLTRRQRIFVDALVHGTSGSESVRQAGYKGLHAHAQAWKWSQRPAIKAAIDEREAQLAQDVGVRQHRVLRQMLAIATADPRKLVDPATGKARPLEKLDEDTAAAISSVEVENISINGEEGIRYKYRFWDKVKANDRLGQYVKLWDAKSATVNVDARTVNLTANVGGPEALRAVADLGQRLVALTAGAGAPSADPDRSVLPAAVCDGPAGRGAPVDAGAHPGSAGES